MAFSFALAPITLVFKRDIYCVLILAITGKLRLFLWLLRVLGSRARVGAVLRTLFCAKRGFLLLIFKGRRESVGSLSRPTGALTNRLAGYRNNLRIS